MTTSPIVSTTPGSKPTAPPPPQEKDEGRFERTLTAVKSKEKTDETAAIERRVAQPLPTTDKRIAQANDPDIELTVIGAPDVKVWDRSTWFPEGNEESWKRAFRERPEWAALGNSTTPGSSDRGTPTAVFSSQSIGDPSLFQSSGRRGVGLDNLEGRTLIAEPFSPRMTTIVLDALYGTTGLTETSPGVYRLNGTPEVTSADLPGGKLGTAGVLDAGGAVRAFIPYPASSGRNPIDLMVKIGDPVRKGDLLFVERNLPLEAERDKVAEQLRQARSDIETAIARAPSEVVGLESQLRELDTQIALQQRKVSLKEGEVGRLSRGQRAGAIALNALTTAQGELASLQQGLSSLEQQRAGLAAQRDQAGQLANLSPERVIAARGAAFSSVLASLPPEVKRAADTYQALDARYAELSKQIDALKTYATHDGVVAQVFPQGTRTDINGRDPDAAPFISNDPTQKVNNGTLAIVPDPTLPASITTTGITPEAAGRYSPGNEVTLQFADGRLASGKVGDLRWRGPNVGYEAVLTDAKFADGSTVTIADGRMPFRVIPASKAELRAQGNLVQVGDVLPREQLVRRNAESSPNVQFEPNIEIVRPAGEFPKAEQTFSVNIPVFSPAQVSASDPKEVVGWLAGSVTVTSDGQNATVKGDPVLQFTPVGREGKATTVPLKVVPISEGSNTAGFANVNSGVRLEVPANLVLSAFLPASTIGFNTPFGGTSSQFPISPTDRSVYVPDIKVVPTGFVTEDRNIVRVDSPVMVEINRFDTRIRTQPEQGDQSR